MDNLKKTIIRLLDAVVDLDYNTSFSPRSEHTVETLYTTQFQNYNVEVTREQVKKVEEDLSSSEYKIKFTNRTSNENVFNINYYMSSSEMITKANGIELDSSSMEEIFKSLNIQDFLESETQKIEKQVQSVIQERQLSHHKMLDGFIENAGYSVVQSTNLKVFEDQLFSVLQDSAYYGFKELKKDKQTFLEQIGLGQFEGKMNHYNLYNGLNNWDLDKLEFKTEKFGNTDIVLIKQKHIEDNIARPIFIFANHDTGTLCKITVDYLDGFTSYRLNFDDYIIRDKELVSKAISSFGVDQYYTQYLNEKNSLDQEGINEEKPKVNSLINKIRNNLFSRKQKNTL